MESKEKLILYLFFSHFFFLFSFFPPPLFVFLSPFPPASSSLAC